MFYRLIRQLLCQHAWTNRREGPAGRLGSFRIWTCSKCGKTHRRAELPIPTQPRNR